MAFATLWDENGGFIEQKTDATFTTTAATKYVRLRNSTNDSSIVTGSGYAYQLEEGSSHTSYAPYENIRPITGRTSAVVAVTGKNLFDKTIGTTDGIRGDDGTPSTSTASGYTDPIGGFEPETQYTIQGTIAGSTGNWLIYYLDKNGGWISRTAGIAYNDVPKTFTTPANCRFIQIQFIRNGVNKDTIQIEKGSTATPYTPYTGTTHTVQFGQTVFGGYVDWVAGQMVLTQALQTKTGSNVQQVGQSSAGVWWALLGGFDYPTEATSSQNMSRQRSNMYVPSANTQTDCSFRIFGGSPNILYAYNNMLDTLEKAQDFYNANNLQIWYPLATPITVPLSDLDEIRTVEGQMNLWADSGDVVEMTYPCDTKLYIEKLTKPSEDDMVANNNIASGKFFMVGNMLFLSTQAIAQGANIVPGTNCTAFSLADALNAINQ